MTSKGPFGTAANTNLPIVGRLFVADADGLGELTDSVFLAVEIDHEEINEEPLVILLVLNAGYANRVKDYVAFKGDVVPFQAYADTTSGGSIETDDRLSVLTYGIEGGQKAGEFVLLHDEEADNFLLHPTTSNPARFFTDYTAVPLSDIGNMINNGEILPFRASPAEILRTSRSELVNLAYTKIRESITPKEIKDFPGEDGPDF